MKRKSGRYILGPVIFSLGCLCSFSPDARQVPVGAQLFSVKCAKCHGADGSREKGGVHNLHLSKLTHPDIVLMIENGKKGMPSFKKKYTADEIQALADFVMTLRK